MFVGLGEEPQAPRTLLVLLLAIQIGFGRYNRDMAEVHLQIAADLRVSYGNDPAPIGTICGTLAGLGQASEVSPHPISAESRDHELAEQQAHH